ncbi:MAG: DUF4231 domain-containing protein [Cyanobacteria bacterium P01_A01_bin.137]
MSTPTTSPNIKLLESAWQRQQAYSKNASRHQRRFLLLRSLLAFLSVMVVILAVAEGHELNASWHSVIGNILLVLPITITALLAFSVRFDRGQNWVLLRGRAESLKTEIYYYRTCVKPYEKKDRDALLSKRIQYISDGIKGSPVHQGALSPYEHEVTPDGKDNRPKPRMGIVILIGSVLLKGGTKFIGLVWDFLFKFKEENSSPKTEEEENRCSDLTDPEHYLQFRLVTQFEWYRKQSKKLAQQLQIFQTSVYILGGVGTLLAAFDHSKSWVAVTTALVGAFTNYLEVKRIEASLVGYNQAADTLYDIRAWWYSLSAAERHAPDTKRPDQKKFQRLVDSCEGTIRSETTSWLQDMQDRLAQLYGIDDGDSDDESNGSATKDVAKEKTSHPDETDENENADQDNKSVD